jgi:hypothetical protein
MDAANPLKIYKQLFNVPLPEDLKSCIAACVTKHFISDKVIVEK